MKLLIRNFAPLYLWRLRRHWANTRADQAACVLIAACAAFDTKITEIDDLTCGVLS